MSAEAVIQERVCRKCGLELPLTQFPTERDPYGVIRFRHVCKECENARKQGRPRSLVMVEKPETRVCAHEGCITKLSRYNTGRHCSAHEKRISDTRWDADKGLPLEAIRVPKEEVMKVDGVTITPEPLPGRKGPVRRDWPMVVREFLASGHDSARIDVKGVKNASSLYSMFRLAIAADPELAAQVYAATRNKAAYLIRIKK